MGSHSRIRERSWVLLLNHNKTRVKDKKSWCFMIAGLGKKIMVRGASCEQDPGERTRVLALLDSRVRETGPAASSEEDLGKRLWVLVLHHSRIRKRPWALVF